MGAPGDLAVQIDTLADTVRVQILGGSVWTSPRELVPEVVIGTADGPVETTFGRVRGLAVAPAGEVYVVDHQVPVLHKFAANGDYLMTFGRLGSGPGEYRVPDAGITVLSDGRVVLRDPGNTRMTIYSSEGAYLDQRELNPGFRTSRRLYRLTGDILANPVLLSVNGPPQTWTHGLVRYDSAGNRAPVIPAPTWDYVQPMVEGRFDGSISSSAVPFTPTPLWTVTPDGAIVAGLGSAYLLTVLSNDLPMTIEMPWTPVPVTGDESREQQLEVEAMIASDIEGFSWDGAEMPNTKPAFVALVAGEDGTIWVQTSQPGEAFRSAAEREQAEAETDRPERRFAEPVVFDVFDRGGRYLGEVSAPSGFSTNPDPVIRGDTVWAAVIDPASGTPQVVRFRLE